MHILEVIYSAKFNRLFSLSMSYVQCVNYSKQANILSKLLNKGAKKKRAWKEFDMQTKAALPLPASISKGSQGSKRVVVLNKLFMKHITDLMATGKSSAEIEGLGVEVTKVKVGSEYNLVNVYWVTHGNHDESKVSQVLAKTAGELRHELSGLRVIGHVPQIHFVRDRTVASWAAVDSLLKTADMGDDYVPKGDDLLKNDFGNETAKTCTHLESEDIFPPMRQNVFGLDRAGIYERVLVSKKGKSRKLSSLHKKETSSVSTFQPFDQEAFAEFLLKQKISKDKLMRRSLEESRYLQLEEEEDDEPPTYSDDEEDYLEEEIES